jgi:hypothetical protein
MLKTHCSLRDVRELIIVCQFGGILDIVRALEQRASILDSELSKVRPGIRALSGSLMSKTNPVKTAGKA